MVLAATGVGLIAVLAFFGFAVPAFDLFNHAQILLLPTVVVSLVVVLALARGWWRAITGVLVAAGLLASASVLVPEFLASQQARPPEPNDRPVITMLTHNLFGLNYDMAKVMEAILTDQPDILVFQEYFGEQSSQLDPMLRPLYPYVAQCRGGKRANIALYARFKFTQVQDGQCPSNAYGTTRTAHIIAQFTLPGIKPFTVMTTHMDWPVPIARHAEELDKLTVALKTVDGPLILAGDFNSTPWAYSFRQFVATNGLLRQTLALMTYPLSWYYFDAWRPTIPFLPLDHVLTRDGIVVHAIKAGQPTGSDHLPVVLRFSVEG